jgi:NADH-quinone oxidoreductase subunit E
MLSDIERREIEAELQHYEQKRAACIDALKIVQRHRGWVSDESIHDIAALLEMTPDELDGVATFYNLIFRKPVGRHVILLCDSVSCWIMGYVQLREHLQARLGINFGETSRDGQFTLLPIPCLGTCDHAPALMIGDELYRDLSPEKLDGILAGYRRRSDGDGATAHPEHQAW